MKLYIHIVDLVTGAQTSATIDEPVPETSAIVNAMAHFGINYVTKLSENFVDGINELFLAETWTVDKANKIVQTIRKVDPLPF